MKVCLSRMRRKPHVRFSGEFEEAIPHSYPTRCTYKLIFICLTILNRMVIIYELNNFLTKNREELN